MMGVDKVDDASLLYAKAHKQNFVKRVVADKVMVPDKVAIFMAGSPGAGTTEVATALAELSDNLCIIDADEFRSQFPDYNLHSRVNYNEECKKH